MLLGHSPRQPRAVPGLCVVGGEGRGGAVAALVQAAAPAPALEVHLVQDLVPLALAPPTLALVAAQEAVLAVPGLAEECRLVVGAREQAEKTEQAKIVVADKTYRSPSSSSSLLLEGDEPRDELPRVEAPVAVVAQKNHEGR